MPNLMDNTPFQDAPHCDGNGCDIVQQIQQIKQNPQAFEEHVRRTNPQAYEQALRIRNSANPQAIAMNLARQKGINPNILRMLGLM